MRYAKTVALCSMTVIVMIQYLNILFSLFCCIEASRSAKAQSMTVKSTGCGFHPHSRNIFLRSGVEAKRGVEFRHSTRNASRIRRKVGNDVY